MKTVSAFLGAALLAVVSGCARPDWIERTTATVDVTGTWEGSAPTAKGQSWFELTLVQQGAQVTGSARGWAVPRSGSLDGAVAGDVFTFRHTWDGRFTGQMRVSGDEMIGPAAIPYTYGQAQLLLRRVTQLGPEAGASLLPDPAAEGALPALAGMLRPGEPPYVGQCFLGASWKCVLPGRVRARGQRRLL